MFGLQLNLQCPVCGAEHKASLGMVANYRDGDPDRYYHKIGHCCHCGTDLLVKCTETRVNHCVHTDYAAVAEKDVGNLTRVGCTCY